tara:strand:- start:3520 stop:4134 length:615 start_codon:yes stop_codon:yes gene_type:complete
MRWLELAILFVGLPIVMAYAIDPSWMWIVLLSAGLVAIVLLYFTEGFTWHSLRQGTINWRASAILGIVTLVIASVLCWWLLPDRLFFLARERWYLLPILAVAYPIILVLPQELIFRPLFFKRYGGLFGNETQAIWVNAILFSFAHLMYFHWVVFAMTFVGSFIFARGYLRGSFPQAMLDHSIAGLMVFVSGLGWLFYSGGNVAH